MKKSFILSLLAGGICYVVLSSNASGYGGNATGSRGASTGANGGCSCHGAQNNLLPVTVELDSAGVAVSRYTPGGAYTIKLSGVNNTTSTLPKFGFQLSAVLANSRQAGTTTPAGQPASVLAGTWGSSLPAGAANVAIGGLNLIRQSSAINATTGTGAAGTTYVISIPWTAPAAGSGAVVLYGVLAAVNANSSDVGDQTNIAKTVFIPELGNENTCN